MTLTLLLPILSFSVPFGSIVNPPAGSTVSYVVECADPNRGAVGAFSFMPSPVPSGLFQQALVKGDKGWNDANLKVVNGQLQTARAGDPTYLIAAPWLISGAWQPAYVRTWGRAPFGASGNEVYPPRDALKVVTERSKIFATVNGSPCESVRLVGSDNDVTVFVVSGEQSRLMQDRPAVYVQGDRNTLRGSVVAPMCGVFVKGNSNRLLDLTVSAGAVGDDIAAIYLFGRGFNGTSLTNVTVTNPGRAYPWAHMVAGVYCDDRHSNVATWNVTVSGFMHGLYSHGGSNQNVRQFKSVGNTFAVTFAPHFTSPTVQPTGNRTLDLVTVN